MPKLPSAAEIAGQRPGLGVRAPPEAALPPPTPRAETAPAAANAALGEALGRLGVSFARVAEEEQQRVDTLRAEEAFNALRTAALDLSIGEENGFTRVRAGDAVNRPLMRQWTEKFEAKVQDIGITLANPRQREAFTRRAGVARVAFQGDIMRHVAQETDRYAAGVYGATLELELRNIGTNPADAQAAGLSFERVGAAVREEARRTGLTPPETAAAQAKARDALWVSRLEAWRLQDPVGALGAFQAAAGEIGPHVRVKLAESLFKDAAPVLAATLNDAGGPPVPASALSNIPAPLAVEPGARLPRGVRNNNPGNLVHGPTRWAGEIEGADPRYASFETPEAGIRALGRNLLAYGAKGVNTIEGVVERWAPATENNTAVYIAAVAQRLGVDPRQPLDMRDRRVLTGMAMAIIQQENGLQPYSAQQITDGIDAALSNAPPPAQRAAYGLASVARLTPSEALTYQTGHPVIDRLPPDQKLAVFQTARTLANQNISQLREALKTRVQDAVAAYERGQDAVNPPNRTELMYVLGQFDGERVADQLEGARVFGQDVKSVQGLPATQQAALLAARTPTPGEGYAAAVARWEALRRAVDTVAKEREQDPALAVLRTSPQVSAAHRAYAERLAAGQEATGAAQAYAAATLAEQARLEIPEPKILTDNMVKAIGQRFAAPPAAGESVPNVMRGMVAQWGRFWPQVGKQLSRTLPPEAVVIGLGVTPEAEQLLADAVRPGEARQGLPETDLKDLRERLKTELEPLQRSVVWQNGGVKTYNDYADAAEKIATVLMQRGLKIKEAAQKAVESVSGFKYEFEETWRVPRAALGGTTTMPALRAGAAAALRDISADVPVEGAKVPLAIPLAPAGVRPEDAERQWRQTLLANGFWVTSPGDGGLTLYVRSGLSAQPVLDPLGRPVTRSWAALAAVGNSVRAAFHRDLPRRRP